MIYWILLLLQFICVCIIDVTGAVDDMLTPLVRKITGSRIGHIGKPFSCSMCMTFWTGVIYLLVAGAFTIPNLAYVLALAVMTQITYLLICMAKDLATKAIEVVYKIFNI